MSKHSIDVSAAKDLWSLWRAVKTLFPTWSLIPSSFYTPGAWGYLGVDFVSGFRQNPSTIRTFDLLKDTDDATFDALSALASLNARRHDQMLRVVILAYLTVPLSIVAVLAEIAGDDLLAFALGNQQAMIYLVLVATLTSAGYLMGHWRSRQIVNVLDLLRIERGQSPFTAVELRED